jgi:hypothetical protein
MNQYKYIQHKDKQKKYTKFFFSFIQGTINGNIIIQFSITILFQQVRQILENKQ